MKDTIQLNTGRASVLLVSLPQELTSFEIGLSQRMYDGYNLLPKGFREKDGYKLIGWSDEITEEQAAELFYCNNGIAYPMFGGIEEGKKKMRNYCKTAKEALQSLLSSNGIEGRKYVLIDNK